MMKNKELFTLYKVFLLAAIFLLLAVVPAMGAVGVDITVSGDGTAASTTISTPVFATNSTNELLLAFISTDYLSGTNTTVSSISGGSLTWVLVKRSNTQSGSSEIWRAFSSNPLSNASVTATLSQKVVASITVVALTGADTSGTNGSGAIGATGSGSSSRGAPTANLVTTRNSSWVFGVGNDFDNALDRTAGTAQSLVHQYKPAVGDTYWVQRQNAATPLSGTTVTINDSAPTTDRFNLAIVEILPALGGGGSTFNISGTISPSTSGSGVTVTLSGAATATVTSDASGNYQFTRLANGSYTVTPNKAGFNFTPVSQPVTINGANVSGINFAAAAQTWKLSGTINPSSLGGGATVTLSGTSNATTTADASGNYTFSGLVNGAYTVTPSKTGSNFSPSSQAASINGANLSGVNFAVTAQTWSLSGTISPSSLGSGATVTLSGTSSATTTADASGNFTFSGLANGPYTVTPSKTGFNFNPSSQAATINGANVSGVNFAATAQTWSLSGTISPSTLGSGATVTLSGTSNATTTADGSGNFTFSGLANGPYTVTPSKSGITFSPASANATISSASVTGISFTASATAQTWSLSGVISPVAAGSGATVALTGTATASTVADGSGNFTFTGLSNGAYTVSPSKAGFSFSPASQPATVNNANVSGINFTGTAQTWSISGTISPSSAATGATVTLSGASSGAVTPDASGNYSFTGLANGSYTVTPTEGGYTFSPSSQSTTVNGASVSNLNFTAQTAGTSTLVIDATSSRGLTSKATTVSTPTFSTNAGNELLLAFVAGDYISGTNTTVTGVTGAGLTWALVKRINTQSGTSEIWRAFAPTSLSGVTVTATLSQSVVSSITVMSFMGADATGSNGSGAIGATASVSAVTGAPSASLKTTRNNSLVLGVGNDFDNALTRVAGSAQTLVFQILTSTGDTYWVQRQNNATPVSGTTVTINDTSPTGDRYNLALVEVLPGGSGGVATPPSVSIVAPAQNATVSGQTTVSANATDPYNSILGVQFQLDGSNLGAEVTSSPYSITWDTSSLSGTHVLTAIAYNSAGLNATSSPITVTVNNSGNGAVVGSWSSPVTLPTVAVDLILLKNNKILFYEDGNSVTLWDYVNSTFTSYPINVDLFCSGHALLADGRVLVVGGYSGSSNPIGIANAEIFDPSNNTWTVVPNMTYRRWYPTATTLSDGRVLVTAGWQTSNHSNAGIPEIYNPSTNSWTQLNSANNPFETYPFIYLLPDGRLIHLGGSEYATDTEALDLSTQAWTTIDPTIVDGGSSVMYQPGKIMKAGSASDSQNSGASSKTTFTIDTTQSSPAWVQTSSMSYARSFFNLVTLPDDSVLAVGGETDKNGGNIANAVYAAELWSPQTHVWTTMSSMHTPREYHSTALLLPDGRVLVSGMGADFGNVPDEKTAEFFSPPYLFKGARPVITQAPAQIQYGTNFFVATPDGASIASATLIRTGAVTHFFDQNTRFVPATFQQTTGGLTVSAPANSSLAPPGHYMLFIVNSNGVPSVAPILQVGP
jgi:Domain of unknown function (DUF1929)/Bacterial Ig domain/Glyoxal oxidase N-terminus/SdrD B-like domain/Kelch motif/Prealbumin-like fold domain